MRQLPTAANDGDASRARAWDPESAELVTYRYFGCRSQLLDRNHSIGSLPIAEDLRTSGGLRLAPLAIAMLEAASNTLDRLYQLWLTQVDVSLYEAGLGVDRVKIENQLLREGRTQAFTEARLLEAPQGRVLGHGCANWAVLSHGCTDFHYSDPGAAPDDRARQDLPPIHTIFGGKRNPHGGYTIDRLSSRIGSKVLHHGPILVLLEQASLDLARSLAGPADIRPQSLSCRIVRAGREGPFTVHAEVYCHTGDLLTCRATIVEDHSDEATVAVMQWQARLL